MFEPRLKNETVDLKAAETIGEEEEDQRSLEDEDSHSEECSASNTESETNSKITEEGKESSDSCSEARHEAFSNDDSSEDYEEFETLTSRTLIIVNGLLVKMVHFIASYYKELSLALMVLLTGLSSLKSGTLKTRSVSSPDPFFDQSQSENYVHDFFRGEYIGVVVDQIHYQKSFVFYYAPWDSESVAAKEVFLEVAKHFHETTGGEIKFYGVNCWWPHGECRQNYKNLSHYPIFVAHFGKKSGIIYNGPIRASLMIMFLNSVLQPMVRIDTEDELWNFMSQHDAIVLAYFNFTDTESSAAFDTYIEMSLRKLEYDPFSQVGFGVLLNVNLAKKCYLPSSHYISLVQFNEIHTARWDGLKKPAAQVADWIMDRTKNVPITWTYKLRSGFANRPVALGPTSLSEELAKGPVLFLISRKYFPSGCSPFYLQLKEVALDYFNCNKSGNVTKLRRTTHKTNSDFMKLWATKSKFCEDPENESNRLCLIMKDSLKHWESTKNKLNRETLANYEAVSSRLNFTGLSCRSRRKIRFIAIDPTDNAEFVTAILGGLGYTLSDEPFSVIIDAQENKVIPLNNFNSSEIAMAIHEFTLGEHGEEKLRTKYWNKVSSDFSEQSLAKSSKSKRLPRLVSSMNGKDFMKFLNLEPPFHLKTPTIILFTATFCGFCSAAMTELMLIAHFIQENYSSQLNLTTAKIDIFENSLPSEWTPEKIPQIVLFTDPERKNPRIFPSNIQISSKTLLRFILKRVDPKTRVEMSLNSPNCKDCPFNSTSVSTCGQMKRQKCISSNQKLLSDQINFILDRIKEIDGHSMYPDCQMEQRKAEALTEKVDNEATDDDSSYIDSAIRHSTRQWRNELLNHIKSTKLNLEVS